MGKPKRGRSTPKPQVEQPVSLIKKIDIALAVRLRIKDGLTYQAIADRFACSEAAVRQALGRFLYLCDAPEQLETYRQQKVGVFETLEHALIERLLYEVVQGRASVGDLARALDVVSKHVRLLAGQSTANIGLLVQTLGEVHKDLGAALEPTLQVVGTSSPSVVGESTTEDGTSLANADPMPAGSN